MHKWSKASAASCECGAQEQTADHIMTSCPIYRHRNGIRGLFTVNGSLARWLLSGTCPFIWSDATSQCNIAPTRRSSYSRNILFYDSPLDKGTRLIFVVIKDFFSCIISPRNDLSLHVRNDVTTFCMFIATSCSRLDSADKNGCFSLNSIMISWSDKSSLNALHCLQINT